MLVTRFHTACPIEGIDGAASFECERVENWHGVAKVHKADKQLYKPGARFSDM